MTGTFVHLAPVFCGFLAGFILRKLNLAEQRDGRFLLKLYFYVCSPALMFTALSSVDLKPELLLLPCLSLISAISSFAIGRRAVRSAQLSSAQQPSFVIACMIVNAGFALPFIQAMLGNEGIAYLSAFDAMSCALMFTWMYAIAAKANPSHTGDAVLLNKLVASPPLYGIALGLVANLANFTVPSPARSVLSSFGAPSGFVLTLAIGLVFSPASAHLKVSAIALSIRLCVGLVLSIGAIELFHLHGAERGVMLLLAVAPIGFNTVTFASLENLDVEFASGMVSISLIVGFVLTSITALLFL